MRERGEISLKVSGCDDETKEAGGPSRCQPTHRSCPLLTVWSWLCVVCIVLVVRTESLWPLSLFICSDDKQSSNSKDGTPRRVLLLCWRLLALAPVTRWLLDVTTTNSALQHARYSLNTVSTNHPPTTRQPSPPVFSQHNFLLRKIITWSRAFLWVTLRDTFSA